MDFNFFESNRNAATFLYGLDHPEVYDPDLRDWELEHHLEECQKLEDELNYADLVARDEDCLDLKGMEEKEEALYTGLLEEQEAANREFLAELRNSPGLGEFVFGPDADDPWPDLLDLLKPKPEDDPDDFEGDSFTKDMGADRAEGALYDKCLEGQVLEDEEFARKYGPECLDYDPSLDDGLWPMEPALAS